MKSNRVLAFLLPVALSGLLLTSGCNKHAQQNSQASGNAPQQASTPAPPPDEPGGATAAPNASPAPTTQGAPTSTPAPSTPENAQNPAPTALVIPAGTHIAIRTHRALGSKISHAGETFTATVVRPIVIDGQTAIPAGAQATGTVEEAKALGRFKGAAYLELRLETVRVNGGSYQIHSNGLERAEKGKGKRSAGFIGGGAGLGAIIGGIAGGGKGALIGGLVGGGAGTAGAGLTDQKNIYIPAESTLTFRLTRAVHISQ